MAARRPAGRHCGRSVNGVFRRGQPTLHSQKSVGRPAWPCRKESERPFPGRGRPYRRAPGRKVRKKWRLAAPPGGTAGAPSTAFSARPADLSCPEERRPCPPGLAERCRKGRSRGRSFAGPGTEGAVVRGHKPSGGAGAAARPAGDERAGESEGEGSQGHLESGGLTAAPKQQYLRRPERPSTFRGAEGPARPAVPPSCRLGARSPTGDLPDGGSSAEPASRLLWPPPAGSRREETGAPGGGRHSSGHPRARGRRGSAAWAGVGEGPAAGRRERRPGGKRIQRRAGLQRRGPAAAAWPSSQEGPRCGPWPRGIPG
ncbi:uncharacterized protein LOC110988134 [Acanthaster planci]|uniref:Uncharacterized protein LOC110988134 n=1 Tax=Acanthaster planci TaxID=133434 RepID=A0A8B7ZQC2_ACAPL|nr:uncharacterized protein LOC110988134 [Acanthaster planci]